MEIFAYSFMQRALVAGVLISLACSVLGVFLILRRDAMLGHGLAEMAFGGIALGLFLHILPLASAVVIAILGALGMLKLKQKAGIHGDTAIGIMASFGMALGILVVSLSGSFNVNLFGYVFGNVLAIRPSEVWLAALLAAVVVGVVIVYYHEFFFMTFDEDAARVSGIRVDLLNDLYPLGDGVPPSGELVRALDDIREAHRILSRFIEAHLRFLAVRPHTEEEPGHRKQGSDPRDYSEDRVRIPGATARIERRQEAREGDPATPRRPLLSTWK